MRFQSYIPYRFLDVLVHPYQFPKVLIKRTPFRLLEILFFSILVSWRYCPNHISFLMFGSCPHDPILEVLIMPISISWGLIPIQIGFLKPELFWSSNHTYILFLDSWSNPIMLASLIWIEKVQIMHAHSCLKCWSYVHWVTS